MTDRDPRDYTGVVPFPEQITLRPIGVVRSTYTERYGTPRQAGLDGPGGDAPARLELDPAVIDAAALNDLDGFDRVWVLAWLHLNRPEWPTRVRPPRGGPRRGLFSTRAPHRPNPIGLSAPRLLRVDGHTVHVAGLDLIDGTPLLDLKPYVPFADAFPDAAAGWVDEMGGAPKRG